MQVPKALQHAVEFVQEGARWGVKIYNLEPGEAIKVAVPGEKGLVTLFQPDPAPPALVLGFQPTDPMVLGEALCLDNPNAKMALLYSAGLVFDIDVRGTAEEPLPYVYPGDRPGIAEFVEAFLALINLK